MVTERPQSYRRVTEEIERFSNWIIEAYCYIENIDVTRSCCLVTHYLYLNTFPVIYVVNLRHGLLSKIISKQILAKDQILYIYHFTINDEILLQITKL